MYILTQDKTRILPLCERDSIGIELGRKASTSGICTLRDLKDLRDSHDIEVEYYLWLYGDERTVIGRFSTESAAGHAISKLFHAIDNEWRIVQIPKDGEA